MKILSSQNVLLFFFLFQNDCDYFLSRVYSWALFMDNKPFDFTMINGCS